VGASSNAFATASGASTTLTITNIVGLSAGALFYVTVGDEDHSGQNDFVAANVFTFGTDSTTGTNAPDATWAFNGTTGFSVEFTAATAHNYKLGINYLHADNNKADSGSSVAGTSDTTCSCTASFSIDASTGVLAFIEDQTGFVVIAVRLFSAGVAGAGSQGSPGSGFSPPTPPVPQGVSVSFGTDALDPAPIWTRLD